MVSRRRPVRSVDGIAAIRWVRDQHSNISHQPCRKCKADAVRCGVQEGCQLIVVRSVEQKVSETGIGIHDFDFREIVISIQRDLNLVCRLEIEDLRSLKWWCNSGGEP